VPAKKPNKPAKRVRYVLSADQRLRRLSLRKMSDGRNKKKSKARFSGARPTPQPDSPHSNDTPHLRWASSRAIGLAMTGVVTLAILIAAGLPSGTTTGDDTRPRLAAQPQAEVEGTATTEANRKIASAPKPLAMNTAATDRATRKSPAPAGVKASPVSAAPAKAPEASEAPAVVTVTGCLDLDKRTVRLKETSGASAPMTRSWRFGFKKRASTIDLVDAGNTLQLQNHVGQRVAATGTLEDRALRVRALRVLSSSCR